MRFSLGLKNRMNWSVTTGHNLPEWNTLLRNYLATAATPYNRIPGEVMFNRPHPLPLQIPASSHRARPPSPQLATSASNAQGQSPWCKPLTVLKLLGNWICLSSDGQMWNALKLRRYLKLEAPLLHYHDTPVRRSQHQNRGVLPARYPDEL
ncbi:hypothetical protein PoB_004669400 [Plakobranchus ocellatus]|uniref:Uncharacterized protein n=1 Tax=Plakobranchus ocellatus TaxID=259542 RepID=A0AAV4BPF2_9GAST|nr:hypothetical protein PoB_004669400 [Plakobranchus ocellatus]